LFPNIKEKLLRLSKTGYIKISITAFLFFIFNKNL